jgi:DNA-directed RNA polymerase subunit alpha
MMNASKFSLLTKNLSTLKPAEHYMIDAQDNRARFRIEPLQKGFGTTIGNALRRIMLSSITGAAVVGVKIEGVDHEYSVLNGIKEDVMDIILNLKSLVIMSENEERKVLHLKASGQKKVTAGMITTVPGIEIVNKDSVICHITDPNSSIDIEIYVGTGNGYVTSEQNKKQLPTSSSYNGSIGIDAVFSPIRRVAYNVETYYSSAHDDEQERLFLTVETNGAISPDVAVAVAAKILQDQVQPFIGMNIENIQQPEIETHLTFDHRLLMRVENLELSVRSQNCLKNENIVYVGDLVTKSELEMLRTPNFGRKSLSEMKEVLARLNLVFGMDVPGWPPEGNLEELARKYEETTQV